MTIKSNLIAKQFLYVLLFLWGQGVAFAAKKPEVRIISPADGMKVKSPVKVVFGLSEWGVAPAGIKKDNTGHHHLLIDVDNKKIDYKKPLPATKQIRHFGGGQTEAVIELPPGKHTLQLLLGDFAHVPHNTPVQSKKITINVSK